MENSRHLQAVRLRPHKLGSNPASCETAELENSSIARQKPVRAYKRISVNSALTRQLIALHFRGYVLDFIFAEHRFFLCLQNNLLYDIGQVRVKLVSQIFDSLNKCYKYLHTIESENGDRGIFLSDTPYVET
ncbi:MAG TPA: hypothetical protein VKB19_20480 [Pedobacter sp.]|nr:hypothetical protein [Pedobacter sp.]